MKLKRWRNSSLKRCKQLCLCFISHHNRFATCFWRKHCVCSCFGLNALIRGFMQRKINWVDESVNCPCSLLPWVILGSIWQQQFATKLSRIRLADIIYYYYHWIIYFDIVLSGLRRVSIRFSWATDFGNRNWNLSKSEYLIIISSYLLLHWRPNL